MKVIERYQRFVEIVFLNDENRMERTKIKIDENLDVIKNFRFPMRTLFFQVQKGKEICKVSDDGRIYWSNLERLFMNKPTFVGHYKTTEEWKNQFGEKYKYIFKKEQEYFEETGKHATGSVLLCGKLSECFYDDEKPNVISPTALKYELPKSKTCEVCK